MVFSDGHPTLGGKHTSKIPHAQKPKVRPPRGWRDHVIFPGRALPTYTGPYSVGTMEIEVPAENPRVFSDITRHGHHMLQLETVLMTVYYPASHEGQIKGDRGKLSRELWLGRPRINMAKGYGRFAGLGDLAIPIFLPAMFTKLPAYRNAPIATYWAPKVDTQSQGESVKTMEGDRPPGAPEKPIFPLVLFSHGLGGTRTMYSSVCGEFASHGFIVCAVEHRDGSGPRTYVNYNKEGLGSRKEREESGGVDHLDSKRRRSYGRVDYIFPKGNPYDTSPNNEKGVDSALREAQIELRVAELKEAYRVMEQIHAGKGTSVAERNMRRKGFKASSSHGLTGVDWDRWKGRFHLDHVTACGHSFGAATVVELLRRKHEAEYVSQGIIYDIWGAGIKEVDEEESQCRIQVPILAINSEAFTYWPSNFDLVASLCREARSEPKPCPAWLMTLRGTVHISQSDFSLLYPITSSFFLKMVANPRRALDLNINASLEFLSCVFPVELAQVNRAYKNENLLGHDCSPLSRIPSIQMQRPDEKYTALRLKIRHEWIYRLSPQLFRKLKRRAAEHDGRRPETGDEVWLHSKPDDGILDDYLDQVHGRSRRGDEKRESEGIMPIISHPTEPIEEPPISDVFDAAAYHSSQETIAVNPTP